MGAAVDTSIPEDFMYIERRTHWLIYNLETVQIDGQRAVKVAKICRQLHEALRDRLQTRRSADSIFRATILSLTWPYECSPMPHPLWAVHIRILQV